MTEGEARQLAWMAVGDQLPHEDEDETMVRGWTMFFLGLAAKAEKRNIKIAVTR